MKEIIRLKCPKCKKFLVSLFIYVNKGRKQEALSNIKYCNYCEQLYKYNIKIAKFVSVKR